MQSSWNEKEASALKGNLIALRVYTSRLLGKEQDLVLHGGGNTSVKVREKDIMGQEEDILYVKGSGWDLATIETQGFAPVKLERLLKLATLPVLSDHEMVKQQRMAMTNPAAPNPSVEAILHAIIPFTFVDHTHADAVVTLTNTPNGEELIREIYRERVLIIPYVMPGFILARTIFEMTKDFDWSSIDTMILMHHGVFTFHDDARASYEKMIAIVDEAERYIAGAGINAPVATGGVPMDGLRMAEIRKLACTHADRAMLARLNSSSEAVGFSSLPNVAEIVSRGPLTPDHIIRTKRTPIIISHSPEEDFETYAGEYLAYFNKHEKGETVLDRAPRWGIIPQVGTLSFGPSPKHLLIIDDISRHTRKSIHQAEALGGWRALDAASLFEMEYWELEQAKLKKAGVPKDMEGRIALVTGAASGIGKASVMALLAQGAVVAALDIDRSVENMFDSPSVKAFHCDVTDRLAVSAALQETVRLFGGLDMVISNAGIFPPSASVDSMDEAVWDRSMEINLRSHQRLLTDCIPYLTLGVKPAVVFIGSKNVPAPGPGASAYSVAKAGLTQLARVASLELGKRGIRVNVIHPNAVYDTAIWTKEVLEARAAHYGLTVEEYKTNNVLGVEVTSRDVAELAVVILGSEFSKITGAQVPIDGGNERII